MLKRLIIFILFLFVTTTAIAADFGESFLPLPDNAENESNKLNADKVELGKKLFFDPRLSKSGFISCNSCHNLATGGVDNLSTSIGHGWQIGPRNAPTVLNAALNTSQFWDGRAKDVEEQAGGPILNPGEMAETEKNVLKKLNSMVEYKAAFRKAFPDEKRISYTNVAKAIAAFERTLLTPSRFDDYLKGDNNAITPAEKKGLEYFVKRGCVSCHNGVNVGGNSFQKFDYGTDEGRFEVTKDEADKKVFRVPTLRNVELTYPYFHDGSVWNLEEAVVIMGEKQLGKKLSRNEVKHIAAFLRTLTAKELNVKIPILPASTAGTPKPDVK